jgi:Pectate lyase superfamily protein
MPDARISELPLAAFPADADLAPLVQANGSGGNETRRASVAQLRGALLADRGAHVRDYGAKGDGATDDAPAIQAAVNELKTRGGGTLLFGPRTYRIASPVVVDGATVRFQGAGFTEGPPPAQGTWLSVDTTGFTPFTFTGLLARGSAMRDIAVQQLHTAPLNASWAPNDYGWVIRVEDCFGGVDFDNLFLCGVNRGILCRNSGRLDIRRLRGQTFACGVEIDECYDVPRIHNVHLWPYWNGGNDVVGWQQANGDALVFRRSDGVFIDQFFALGYRSVFRFASSAAGATTKFYIGQAYTDFAKHSVLVEGNHVTGQIAGLTTQGEIFGSGGAPLPGSCGVLVTGAGARLQIANLRVDTVEDNPVRLEGSNNRLDLFSLRCVRFNTRANNAAAIHLADSGAAAPNTVYLGSPALLEGPPAPGPLVNAGTNGVLSTQAPAGRAARPGLAVGGSDAGLFAPSATSLAASVGGSEVLRATAGGGVTFGGAPGGHALEVATPGAAANRVVVSGASAGSPVSVQAQGTDANIGLALSPRGNGALTANLPDGAAAGGNARGAGAVDWQTVRDTASKVASGAYAVAAGGRNNTASGNDSAVGGGNANTGSGSGSTVAGGTANAASGTAAWCPGGSFATTRGVVGRGAWGSGAFGTAGDAQAGEHVLRRQTADAAAGRLTADGGAPGPSNTANLPAGGTYLVRLMVVARQVGGTSGAVGDSAGWSVEALVRRGATAASTAVVGGGAALAPGFADAGASAWRLSVAPDTANGGLAVGGAGEAGKTINWVARILSAETVG